MEIRQLAVFSANEFVRFYANWIPTTKEYWGLVEEFLAFYETGDAPKEESVSA